METPEKTIQNWLKDYVAENGGIEACRHGNCFELVDDFINSFPDAQMWETLEMKWETPLPLVLSHEEVESILKQEKQEFISEVGCTGGHAVCSYKGIVFDAAGISTFEEITLYFHSLQDVHWFRSQ